MAVLAHLVKKVVSTSGEDAERAAAEKLAAALTAKVRGAAAVDATRAVWRP